MNVVPRLRLDREHWRVSPAGPGHDEIFYGDVKVGEVFWLRNPKLHSVARIRMSDGLNGARSGGARKTWSARVVPDPVRGAEVWAILHNGEELAELRWLSPADHPTRDLLAGLNMLAGGRRPWACEPEPINKPILRVVR